jgi:hypothetical protein
LEENRGKEEIFDTKEEERSSKALETRLERLVVLILIKNIIYT